MPLPEVPQPEVPKPEESTPSPLSPQEGRHFLEELIRETKGSINNTPPALLESSDTPLFDDTDPNASSTEGISWLTDAQRASEEAGD